MAPLSISDPMVDKSSCLTRLCCSQHHSYIYLYSPKMSEGGSCSTRCLLVLLFSLCLALIVILTGLIVYHRSPTYWPQMKTSRDARLLPLIDKRHPLPDFVNLNIDPCEHFYEFVCNKSNDRERNPSNKWKTLQSDIHHRLMTTSISAESSLAHFYQLCETKPSSLLVDEMEQYFNRLRDEEPYRSYLTLFIRTDPVNISSFEPVLIFNPFFTISNASSSDDFRLVRRTRRSLPSVQKVLSNSSHVNQTALKELIQFEHDYEKFLQDEHQWIKSYQKQYNEDSLIIQRILTFRNTSRCQSTIRHLNGMNLLIGLLHDFLHDRLRQFNTKLIDQQIDSLHQFPDNHTLVQYLRRLHNELKMIEQVVRMKNESSNSCVIDLLDQFLNPRIELNELPSFLHRYLPRQSTESFISKDWPFLVLIADRLLKKISLETLTNFFFVDHYRHLIYPYYQVHLSIPIDFTLNRTARGYSYENDSIHSSCQVRTCFNVLHCFHPSLLNRWINDENQIDFPSIEKRTRILIDRFRLLTEQSDYLYFTEKKRMIDQLNRIEIRFGHFTSDSMTNELLQLHSSSYLDYVQLFASMPFDHSEASYQVEPMFYLENHTLFLPFGFLIQSNKSLEYSVGKLLLKILRQTIQSNPFHIECLIKSSEEIDPSTPDNDNDEHFIYLLFRSKYLHEREIHLDQYLWPFMSANFLMKSFLIDYAANHYCSTDEIRLRNNSFFLDDIYLVFHCHQANFIRQSKCTVT